MLAWVVYAHNSIFLVSLRTMRWTHSYFTDEESEEGRVQLCQPVTDIGPQHRSTGPKPHGTDSGGASGRSPVLQP